MLGEVMGVRDDSTQCLVVAFGPGFRELAHPVITLGTIGLVSRVIGMQSLDELLVQRPQAVVGRWWWRGRKYLSHELLPGRPGLVFRLTGPDLVARRRFVLGTRG